ncbi:superoxide dismutase family protein [Sorangium sp. So ce1036]|uniref:superoxide dismutase family protein n=1 Tax=Sorangium sp. So ce1036 TaxID=3133328 RepID=UPI003EFE2454
MSRWLKLSLVALGAGALLSACGDDGESPSESTTTPARAEAQIQGMNSSPLSGTATFTQTGDEVTLTITLEGCPAGEHSAHLHANKSCDENGDAAGGHWIPNGEGLGSFTCDASGQGTQTITRATDVWTIGDASATDVTQFSIVVHAAADPDAGGRIGCGLIDLE